MSITTTSLTRVAALCAIAAGALFMAVQINHPPVDLALVTTPEWVIRQTLKVLMTVFSLIGITGIYLSQVKRAGVLGLIGYLVFGTGYLAMFSVEVAGLVILPMLAHTAPGYVSDVLAIATNVVVVGDVGLMQVLNLVAGFGYLGGGLLFGIALFRANVLARWAAVLLAVATTVTAAIPMLPINQRLFAIPTGVALIGLGYSLWRTQASRRAVSTDAASPVATAGVR